jgi:hypothetical protein
LINTTIESIQSTFNLVFTFLSLCRIDLLFVTSIPWIIVVLSYLPFRRHLAEGEAPSLSSDGAPNCYRNRQNWIIRFAKPDNPIFVVSSMSFRFLFISCGNIFWCLCWGIDYFKHVKHERVETLASTDLTSTRTTSSSLPLTP